MASQVMPAMIDYRRPLALEAPPRYEHVDLECVNRVSHLPLVESVIHYAQGVIESAKESNLPFVGLTVGVAEEAAKFAAQQAQQVASNFEGPLHLLDSLACRGVDILERNVPVVNHTPEELVHQAKSYVADRVRPTAELFMTAKDVGQEAAGMALHQGRRAMETGANLAGSAREGAMHAANIGMDTAGQAAGFGLETAGEAARYGREKVGQAADIGREGVSRVMRFGKDTAEQAADMGAEAMDFGREKVGEGMERVSHAVEFGREKAQDVMEFGKEKAHDAVEIGKEKAHEAVEFGKEKAMRAAKSPYGQMAAKRLDKAVIMADTFADTMMPPDLAEGVRKRERIDVAKATKEWEPELRPLGHAVAIGTQLFKKVMAMVLWQTMGVRRMISLMMMPMIHPLNFADMVITNIFRAPPVMIKMARDMVRISFNIAMAFTPWRMYRNAMDMGRGFRRRLMEAGKNAVQTLYNYVPEEAVQVARQTRTQLEQTKWAAPEFGESLPRGKKGHEIEDSEGSGYHSEDAEIEHQKQMAERKRLEKEQLSSQLPEKMRDREVHRRKEQHKPLMHHEEDVQEGRRRVQERIEEERRKQEEKRREGERKRAEEERKHEERKREGERHQEERKKEGERHQEERKREGERHHEERKREGERKKAEGESKRVEEERKKAEGRIEEERRTLEGKKKEEEHKKHDVEHKKHQEQRQRAENKQEEERIAKQKQEEEERIAKHQKEEQRKAEQREDERKAKEDESKKAQKKEDEETKKHEQEMSKKAEQDRKKEEDKSQAQTKINVPDVNIEDIPGSWDLITGPKKSGKNKPEEKAEAKGEEMKRVGEGQTSGSSKDDHSIPSDKGQRDERRRSETEPSMPGQPGEMPSAPSMLGEQKPQAWGAGKEGAPTFSEVLQQGGQQGQMGQQPAGGEAFTAPVEQPGIADSGYEADVDVPIAEEAGTSDEPSTEEHKRVKREDHEGDEEHKHHRSMTPLEEEFTYHGELGDMETLTEDENWRRENMPSVPLNRKSPTHHDIVEEGVIPQVLPEFAAENEKKIE